MSVGGVVGCWSYIYGYLILLEVHIFPSSNLSLPARSACLRFVSSVRFVWVSALPWYSSAYVFIVGFLDVNFSMP